MKQVGGVVKNSVSGSKNISSASPTKNRHDQRMLRVALWKVLVSDACGNQNYSNVACTPCSQGLKVIR